MGALTLRITPASTIPLLGGNLGVVTSNRSLTTLEQLQQYLARMKAGAESLTTGGVPNTVAVRCDVNPVAATGTVTIGGTVTGTVSITINGVAFSRSASGDETANAAAFVVAINASTNALVSGVVLASSVLGVVTLTAIGSAIGIPGNFITTAAAGTGMTADQTRLTGGTDGTAQVAAVKASGTFTFATASGSCVATINGQTVTVTATGTDATDAAAMATAILASEKVGIRGVVTATSALGVVTVTALQAGTGDIAKTGNGVTTTATGTNFTAAQAVLAGGLNAVSTRFTY